MVESKTGTPCRIHPRKWGFGTPEWNGYLSCFLITLNRKEAICWWR